MSVSEIVVDWLRAVAIAVPVFVAIERLRPRRRMPIAWKAIAIAALLFGANRFVVKLVNGAPMSDALWRILFAWGLVEVTAYGVHRAMHAMPWLWRFHKLHHDPAPLAFHRSWWIHPVDIAVFGAATTAVCHLAGAPIAAAPWFLVLRRGWAVLLHANLAWPQTWIDRVIVTPAVHDRHHREDLPPANFAANFAILDRVFGTWAATPAAPARAATPTPAAPARAATPTPATPVTPATPAETARRCRVP
jgi:sterol desaturase/sphingolipid hydroxylase (fatty acid hydroxylase superfamily)